MDSVTADLQAVYAAPCAGGDRLKAQEFYTADLMTALCIYIVI